MDIPIINKITHKKAQIPNIINLKNKKPEFYIFY